MSQPQLQTNPPPPRSGQAQIIHAATIVVIAFIASRILGLLRDILITHYFGVESVEAVAYAIATRFPDTIFYIIAGGALGSAFIPTFSGYFARDDAAGGWRLFSAISNLVIVVTTVVAALAALFAPQLIFFSLPELITHNPELLAISVRLTRVMLLSPIIFGVSGVIMGALNARQHFVLPAVAAIIYNLGIILGVVFFAPDVMGLAIGTVAGAAGHLAIQIPGLRRHKASYTPILTVRDPGVKQVLWLMAPRMLGLSFGQLNHLATPLLAQAMDPASVRALDIAWRVMIMPHGILGQALGIAAFPTFADLAARNALAEMRRILAGTLRLIFFLGLPATIGIMLLRRPLVALLFQSGECDTGCVDFIAWGLLFYTAGLIALTCLEVISRAFYAMGDTRTPVLAGIIQLVAMVLLGLWFSYTIFPALGWLQLGGLALGVSLSNIIETAILLWWLRGRMGGINGRYLADGLWRMGVAGIAMAGVVALLQQQISQAGWLWQLSLGGLIGGAVYTLGCYWLNVNEVQQLLAVGLRTVGIGR